MGGTEEMRAQKPASEWDMDAVFDADYFHFYGFERVEEAAARTKHECDFILSLLDPPKGGRMLDICCGHGRHGGELARRGYRVVGIDRSEYFLKIAMTERTPGASVVLADARAISVRAESTDSAFSYFTSIGYGDEDRDLTIFREAFRALRSGGRFLVETNSGEFFRRAESGTSEWKVETDRGRMIDRTRFHPEENRMRTERNFERFGKPPRTVHFSVRLYSPEKITGMLGTVGFTDVRAFSEKGEPFSKLARRLVVVASRG